MAIMCFVMEMPFIMDANVLEEHMACFYSDKESSKEGTKSDRVRIRLIVYTRQEDLIITHHVYISYALLHEQLIFSPIAYWLIHLNEDFIKFAMSILP